MRSHALVNSSKIRIMAMISTRSMNWLTFMFECYCRILKAVRTAGQFSPRFKAVQMQTVWGCIPNATLDGRKNEEPISTT
jgi:formate C-acetyltransferase